MNRFDQRLANAFDEIAEQAIPSASALADFRARAEHEDQHEEVVVMLAPADNSPTRPRWLIPAALGLAAAGIAVLGGAIALRSDSDDAPQVSDDDTALRPDPPVVDDDPWRTVSYSVASGLPPGGVDGIAAADDTAWAVVRADAGLQMYRLDGDRWLPTGEAIDSPYHQWMIPDGAGGVLLSVPTPDRTADESDGPDRVVRFDGQDWIGFDDGIELMPGLAASTVVSGSDGVTWIAGYVADESSRLVVGRVAGGEISVSLDDRLPLSWPSSFTIGYTVDVAPDGAVWVGSLDGATRFDGDRFEFFGIDETEAFCCYAPLTVDTQGAIWLLRDRTLRRLTDGVWSEMPPIEALHDDAFGPIVATPDGAVWVFSHDTDDARPTYRFDGVGWTMYSPDDADTQPVPISSSSAFRVVRGPDGTIVTTESPHRFVDDRWERLPTDDLAPGPVSSADWSRRGVAIGDDGSIWLPAVDGIVRLVPAD